MARPTRARRRPRSITLAQREDAKADPLRRDRKYYAEIPRCDSDVDGGRLLSVDIPAGCTQAMFRAPLFADVLRVLVDGRPATVDEVRVQAAKRWPSTLLFDSSDLRAGGLGWSETEPRVRARATPDEGLALHFTHRVVFGAGGEAHTVQLCLASKKGAVAPHWRFGDAGATALRREADGWDDARISSKLNRAADKGKITSEQFDAAFAVVAERRHRVNSFTWFVALRPLAGGKSSTGLELRR